MRFLQIADSSVRRGSILREMEIRRPKAVEALTLTSLDGSFSDLINVVCSCGTKAFSACPPFSNKMLKVYHKHQ